MRIFSYTVSKAVVSSFGLDYPENFQLHLYTRRGVLVNIYNLVFGRTISYWVWRHSVYLSDIGAYRLYTDCLNLTHLRGVLQEAERSPWRALLKSLRS